MELDLLGRIGQVGLEQGVGSRAMPFGDELEVLGGSKEQGPVSPAPCSPSCGPPQMPPLPPLTLPRAVPSEPEARVPVSSRAVLGVAPQKAGSRSRSRGTSLHRQQAPHLHTGLLPTLTPGRSGAILPSQHPVTREGQSLLEELSIPEHLLPGQCSQPILTTRQGCGSCPCVHSWSLESQGTTTSSKVTRNT